MSALPSRALATNRSGTCQPPASSADQSPFSSTAIRFPSSDGFDIKLEGFVEWSVDPEKLPLTYSQYAEGHELLPFLEAKVILPYGRSFCRLAGSSLPPSLEEDCELVVAADHRRRTTRPVGLEAALRRTLVRNPEGHHWADEAFEAGRSDRVQVEHLAQEPARTFGDHHRAGRSNFLEPRGQVRRLPDHRLLTGSTLADEVPGERRILLGTAGKGDVTADEALGVLRKHYPGKAPPIEQALVHNWASDPWAPSCERLPSRQRYGMYSRMAGTGFASAS